MNILSLIQVEEGKVERMQKGKVMTKKVLQDAIEKGQIELAIVRKYFTISLIEAKDAKARVDSETKVDLEWRCRESADREIAIYNL